MRRSGQAVLWSDECSEGIKSQGLLKEDLSWNAPPGDSTLMADAGISPFDLAVARFRIEALMRHWPSPSKPGRPPMPSDPVDQMAYQSASNTISWSKAKDEAAEYYADRKEYAASRREMLGVAHESWRSLKIQR